MITAPSAADGPLLVMTTVKSSAVSYTAQGPMLKVAGVDVPIANVTQATTAPGNGTQA